MDALKTADDVLAEEVIFRIIGKPRKWRDWHLSPIKKRKKLILTVLKKNLRLAKKNGLQFDAWLVQNLINHLKLLKGAPLEIQELYIFILFSALPKAKFSFIEHHSLSLQTAHYNQVLKRKFLKQGIEWDCWKTYPEFKVEIETSDNKRELWRELNNILCSLIIWFGLNNTYSLLPSALKDCAAIRKNKKAILNGEFELPEGEELKALFRTVYKSAECIAKKRGISIEDVLSHYDKQMSFVSESIREIICPKVRNFKILLWGRVLGELCLGNAVANCLSIGKKDTYPVVRLPGVPGKRWPAGILDYLMDDGIQVVRIDEEDSSESEWHAGHCYLYVFLYEGAPALMVDSIEMHQSYQGRGLSRKIRGALFEFLRGYALAVGIKRIMLGKAGPILQSGKNKGKRHKIVNDLDVDDLPVVKLDVTDKLGGYWNHQRYFLESIGGDEAYVIM